MPRRSIKLIHPDDFKKKKPDGLPQWKPKKPKSFKPLKSKKKSKNENDNSEEHGRYSASGFFVKQKKALPPWML